MKDRPGVDMLKQYEMVADRERQLREAGVQVGPPCASCGHWGAVASMTGARNCEHPQFSRGWTHGDRREFDCDGHTHVNKLEGVMLAARRARVRLRLAIQIRTGENVGSVNDPRHPSPKPERKRRKK